MYNINIAYSGSKIKNRVVVTFIHKGNNSGKNSAILACKIILINIIIMPMT